VQLASSVAELIELPDGNILALGEAGATWIELARVIPHGPLPEVRTP
jgi:hypothetical protein